MHSAFLPQPSVRQSVGVRSIVPVEKRHKISLKNGTKTHKGKLHAIIEH